MRYKLPKALRPRVRYTPEKLKIRQYIMIRIKIRNVCWVT